MSKFTDAGETEGLEWAEGWRKFAFLGVWRAAANEAIQRYMTRPHTSFGEVKV